METKQYKYIYGIGRSSLDIPESDIRYAMENTKSNAEAARFLKVSFTTYKKYARMYVDRETGKTLYEIHKNQFKNWKNGKKMFCTSSKLFDKYGLETCKIELLEKIECNSMKELQEKEQYYLDFFDGLTINRKRAVKKSKDITYEVLFNQNEESSGSSKFQGEV